MAEIKKTVDCSYCGSKNTVSVITKQSKYSRSIQVVKCTFCKVQNGIKEVINRKTTNILVMPTTLKNGMYVTPPISNEYLTQGKRYEVSKVRYCEVNQSYVFKITDDSDEIINVALISSAHINNLNWKIVEL